MVVIGTKALEYHNLSPRQAKDVDMFTDGYETLLYNKGADIHVLPLDIIRAIPHTCGFALPSAIYTIKCSHAAWDIKWEKTINDIVWLKRKGCVLIEPLYWQLYAHWKTVHGNKQHLSLKKTKDAFFDDYVPYAYEHDWLHKVVALPNAPMYTKVQAEGEEVLLAKEKFDKLEGIEKLQLFREEIQVIALERWLIPSKFRISPVEAYRRAFKKTITNLTKNWATLFILENAEVLKQMQGKVWVNNFKSETGVQIMTYPADIQKLKDKAEELDIDGNYEIEEMLVHGYEGYEDETENGYGEFYKFLKEMDFECISQEGGGEGGGEHCEAVIKLNNKFYKLTFSYYSYDGFQIDDIWDWIEVSPVKREVTFYE